MRNLTDEPQNIPGGLIDSPAGQAPALAWVPVHGEVVRPFDQWISADEQGRIPRLDWEAAVAHLGLSPGAYGVRVRFVSERSARNWSLDGIALAGEILDALGSEGPGRLFFNFEMMEGPETGLFISKDNRAPALLTQAWIKGRNEVIGELPKPAPPLHLNVIFHDQGIRFSEAWHDGTLRWAAEQSGYSQTHIHQLTMARSQARPHGISLGLEHVGQETGASGGGPGA